MTNKTFYRKILIPLLFSVLILFAINFQVTLWYGLFGSFVAPALWPTIFVYLCTNRERKKRGGWIAFFFLVICAYTVALPLYVFLALVVLAYLIRFTQKRFSAIDTTDLIAFSLISTFVFPILYAVLASLETEFVFNFWRHVFSSLLAFPFIPIMLYASRKIDRVLNVEEGVLLVRI